MSVPPRPLLRSVGLALACLAPAATAQPRVTLEPSTFRFAPGGATQQTFEVHIRDFAGLDGYSIPIFYDPAVVRVVSITRKGELLNNAGGSAVCPDGFSSAARGIVQVDCGNLAFTASGYSGSDAVAFAVTFERVGTGTTVLTVNDNYYNYSQSLRLSDANNVDIPGATVAGAVVSVDRPSPVAAVMRTLLDFETTNRDSAETAFAALAGTAARHRVRANGDGGRLTVARYDAQAPGGNAAPYTDPDGTLAMFATPPRYWELTNSFTGSVLQDVAFSYAGLVVNNPSDLRLARRALAADGTTTWQVIPSARTSVDTGLEEIVLTSASASDVASGQYAIVGSPAALPVELTAFTAVADGEGAVLRWTTASETRSARFTVEHRAPAQTSWSHVGERAAQGTTSETHHYTLRVGALAAGRHAFRLHETDLDGVSRLVGTVELETRSADALSVRLVGPSPVRGALRATVTAGRTGPSRVDLVDVTGRTVATLHDGTLAAGAVLSLGFDAASLPAGAYWIRARSDAGVRSVPVIVAR